MKYINNRSTNPYFNLALEEYFLKDMNFNEDYFILWQNEPTVVIGKHQNTIEEINASYVEENNINVVRRISGGGAVYHDFGNLNFTFIQNNADIENIDFKRYTLPIILALKKLGIKTEFTGRNDLTIGGKKFSGNSQHIYKDRLLHHGTLLFDSDLDMVQNALNVKADKIQSKGVKSVRSRVSNIKEFITDKDLSINKFKSLLIDTAFSYYDEEYKEHNLSSAETSDINNIMMRKYWTWKWNYGQSPPFNFKNSKRFNGGKVEVVLYISEGSIESCKIYGDFIGLGDIESFENSLINLRYDENTLNNHFNNMNISLYFGNISKNELLSCFING